MGALNFKTEIFSIRKETDNLFIVQLKKPAGFTHIPGQYIKIYAPDAEHFVNLAIASHSDENLIELLINSHGKNAQHLCLAAVGSLLEISAPIGEGFPAEKFTGKTIYLISHGSGISAMKPLIYELRKNRNQYGPIRFIYGVRTQDDFPYKSLLRDWMGSIELYDIISEKPDNLRLWSGETGYVQDIIKLIKPDPENAIAAITGSEEMEKDVTRLLTEFGFKREQILLNH